MILNKRLVPAGSKAVYVGRPSEWGNPFTVERYGRGTALEKYIEWIYRPEQKALRNRMRRILRGQDLICWCAPLPCHAEIIAEIAASEIEP